MNFGLFTWIKLEFDKNYHIHEVIYYYKFYTDWFDPEAWCSTGGVPRFRSCVDIDTNVEVLVYQGDIEKKSCGVLHLTYGLEQSDQIHTLICDTDGDSLVLRKRQGPIAVYEIAVIGEGTFFNFKINFEKWGTLLSFLNEILNWVFTISITTKSVAEISKIITQLQLFDLLDV